MTIISDRPPVTWRSLPVWKAASINTLWCLLGCSIGDFGTILFFQLTGIPWSTLAIMTLAIINGILTSILLETLILARQMPLKHAFQTAIGMSLVSMLAMEIAMNGTDVLLTGEARLTPTVIPIMLLVGFLTPLPYNYWRLMRHGKACH